MRSVWHIRRGYLISGHGFIFTRVRFFASGSCSSKSGLSSPVLTKHTAEYAWMRTLRQFDYKVRSTTVAGATEAPQRELTSMTSDLRIVSKEALRLANMFKSCTTIGWRAQRVVRTRGPFESSLSLPPTFNYARRKAETLVLQFNIVIRDSREEILVMHSLCGLAQCNGRSLSLMMMYVIRGLFIVVLPHIFSRKARNLLNGIILKKWMLVYVKPIPDIEKLFVSEYTRGNEVCKTALKLDVVILSTYNDQHHRAIAVQTETESHGQVTGLYGFLMCLSCAPVKLKEGISWKIKRGDTPLRNEEGKRDESIPRKPLPHGNIRHVPDMRIAIRKYPAHRNSDGTKLRSTSTKHAFNMRKSLELRLYRQRFGEAFHRTGGGRCPDVHTTMLPATAHVPVFAQGYLDGVHTLQRLLGEADCIGASMILLPDSVGHAALRWQTLADISLCCPRVFNNHETKYIVHDSVNPLVPIVTVKGAAYLARHGTGASERYGRHWPAHQVPHRHYAYNLFVEPFLYGTLNGDHIILLRNHCVIIIRYNVDVAGNIDGVKHDAEVPRTNGAVDASFKRKIMVRLEAVQCSERHAHLLENVGLEEANRTTAYPAEGSRSSVWRVVACEFDPSLVAPVCLADKTILSICSACGRTSVTCDLYVFMPAHIVSQWWLHGENRWVYGEPTIPLLAVRPYDPIQMCLGDGILYKHDAVACCSASGLLQLIAPHDLTPPTHTALFCLPVTLPCRPPPPHRAFKLHHHPHYATAPPTFRLDHYQPLPESTLVQTARIHNVHTSRSSAGLQKCSFYREQPIRHIVLDDTEVKHPLILWTPSAHRGITCHQHGRECESDHRVYIVVHSSSGAVFSELGQQRELSVTSRTGRPDPKQMTPQDAATHILATPGLPTSFQTRLTRTIKAEVVFCRASCTAVEIACNIS
ncbi:hypothetical protein PR048_032911 [Dryococelus australis]|uniref:Uncharacterized protein n=1 Tax=Dryococelus australis TaxID=614101 RepID=A0ABQ9G3K6_9NEOP|nr:hypothetical protein PR048_032911 [Dryococelus australis]